jgi:endonuclease/exonuclease/phosphatase family metal-dependent hydrolase
LFSSNTVLRCLFIVAFFAASALAEERDLAKGIVFCTYNVRNWVGDDQRSAKGAPAKPKSESEKEAVIQVLREVQPDIVGVCEMGSPAQFEDFLARVKPLGLVHSEYVEAADPDRHLALVSRFPIVAKNSQSDIRFMMGGIEERMRRGILDATIQVTPAYRLRCVGAHLKSKLPSAEGEALVRRHESSKLRTHLDAILKTEPAANLLCYGDFNDTRDAPAFQEISGIRATGSFVEAIPAKDDSGDRWTHYWKDADQYSRIDFIFASRGILPELVRDSGRVNHSENWNTASDHRAVSIRILPAERKAAD